MNIGIIGAGNMGSSLGKLWADQGHNLVFSFTRDPGSLEAAAAAAGAGARKGTPLEAAQFGEVVLLTVPWAAIEAALKDVAPALQGKVLIS